MAGYWLNNQSIHELYFFVTIEYLLAARYVDDRGEKAGHDHDRLSQARRGMHRDRADRAHAFPTHHAAAHCRDVDESGPRRGRQSVADRGSGSGRGHEPELTARRERPTCR